MNPLKEQLFVIKIQIKKSLVTVIFDSGSQRNLILDAIVKWFGLPTTKYPSPYTLGWLNRELEHTIDWQCKFKFSISEEFIDEVECNVVPIDVCRVIFGRPYLWDRDVEF